MTLPRVVIAHDFLETYGGAERVTAAIAEAFPEAPVYAILGRESVAQRMGVADRLESVLPSRDRLLRHYRLATPILGRIVERAELPPADLLITSSYAFALRFQTANSAPQLSYCHSPLRFAWSMTDHYRDEWARSRLSEVAFHTMARAMRKGDRRAAEGVARFVTQSPFVADQIREYYGRDADVIGAPIDCDLFHPATRPESPDDYYLFCGRLIEPYKRVSETVRAFGRLGLRLIVAGDGPALPDLRRTAAGNVEFTGHLADSELVPLMQRCRALVFPSRDDFGLLPLEVMACGRPVLAFAGGGARYTVAPGITGELFSEQTDAAIEAAVASFEPSAYSPDRIRAHAEQWDAGSFRERLVRAAVEVAQ